MRLWKSFGLQRTDLYGFPALRIDFGCQLLRLRANVDLAAKKKQMIPTLNKIIMPPIPHKAA